MSNFLFKDRDGQTPLPEELQKGLIPKHIQNMGELDEYEEANIAEGLAWLEKSDESCPTYNFWQKLHKKLFSNVWTWAGQVRKHDINNPFFHTWNQIWPALKELEKDLEFWISQKKMPFQEIAARFHEKIETIHPFPNGNGRFGRILVEHFCKQHGEVVPTWGASLKGDPPVRRKTYIDGLYQGRRNGNYEPLIKFMYD